MGSLVSQIRRAFDFQPGAEWTCEFNPGDMDSHKMAQFRSLGINRISLGVQAFQDRLLKAMARHHTVEDIGLSVKMIRNHGIKNISFDLISGLPGQSLEDFKESLECALELEPSQVSLYDLEIHSGTAWAKLLPAGDSLRAEMFQMAIDVLTNAGYEQYEISSFAKPGFESRHNLLYWKNQEYLGLGPGAFSYMEGVRSQFSLEVPEYLQKCETGDWEPAVKDVLTEEEKEVETLVTGLRLKQGVNLQNFIHILNKMEERFLELENLGLILRVGSHAALTTRGRFLVEQTFGILLGRDSASTPYAKMVENIGTL